MEKIIDNSRISKHLGKSSEYKSTYDNTLLVREPRQSNRTHLGIDGMNLPFVGYDTWNAYEVSALTNLGLPVTGVAKIVYECDSEYIVESKSLKLYLNSFNMTKLGDNAKAVRLSIEDIVRKDLSALLGTDVAVNVASDSRVLEYNKHTSNVEKYSTIEEEYPVDIINISKYIETPELLEVVESVTDSVYYHSSLLKSNCRVTSQPDWGDVYVYIKNKGHTIDPISFLKYIISFRDECHFHEEISEAIYKRIFDALHPEELVVKCLYARRGGIDINPIRSSHSHLLNSEDLINSTVPHVKTPKQ